MSKVLIISTSLRGGSNSEFLAREFEKGAMEAGNEVEFISLIDFFRSLPLNVDFSTFKEYEKNI